MDQKDVLGHYTVTPNKTFGWYDVTAPWPEGFVPDGMGGARHHVATVDSQLGAIGFCLGANFIQARLEKDAAAEARALEAIDFVLANIP